MLPFEKEKVREVCWCAEEPTSGFSSLVPVPAGRGVPVRSAPGKHQADGIRGGGQGLERRGRGGGAHVQRLRVREQHGGGEGAAGEPMCATDGAQTDPEPFPFVCLHRFVTPSAWPRTSQRLRRYLHHVCCVWTQSCRIVVP